jgi:phage tail sheath gpL-like
MVSFNQIPSNLRIPFVTAEFDSSRASQGVGTLAYRALIIGQKHGAGTAAANSLHRVTSADQVATLGGRGSMLHRQAIAWFAANKSTELYIGVLADNSAGVIAEGSITLSGTATKAGTLTMYLGGQKVEVAVAVGDTAANIAAALATEIGKHATGTVTCAAADAADNFTIGGTLDGVAASVTFVGTAGAVVPGAATYSIDTGNSEAAASLAAQINAHATASRLVRATASSAVVTLRAVAPGTAGNAVTLATTDAVDLAVSATTLTGGVAGENPDLAMHASVNGAVVSLRANNAGAVGNEYDVRANYRPDSEVTPEGITVAIVQPTGGASNPSLTALITALGDTWFQIITHPYTDSTSLTALETELASRAGPMRQIDGVAITAKDDTFNNVSTLGDSRNSQFSVIVRTCESPTPVAEYAAHVAAVIAYHAEIDPARPFQTLELPFVLAPALGDREGATVRNQIVGDGISTTKVGGGGDMVMIETTVTTYQLNAAGSPDESYRQLNTVLSLMLFRFNFRSRLATRYPRHKLGNDSTNYPTGEAIMTPSLGRAEMVSAYIELSTTSPVILDPAGIDQFKADLVVERNEDDPNRLDFLVSPDVINQLLVAAAKIQFKR